MTSALLSRLYGYAVMTRFAATRWPMLGEAQLLAQLDRQIHLTGIAALPVIATLAALTGATTMTQVLALTGQDSDVAQKWLFFSLYFELAPLLSALVLVARSSASMASELAVMHLHDEFTALRRMGVPASDYLLLPRIWATALALPVLTIFYQVTAVASGWLAVALLQNQPLPLLATHFFDLADPWMAIISLLKSAVMGALVGVIACHHGTSTERSTRAISDSAIHAVGNGLVAVFVVDIAFAIMTYLIV
jgi:phospholipid/cholesterol/gamma-HCH transport system permease protein